jgi:rSAM/selenodomain-associated transferase 1
MQPVIILFAKAPLAGRVKTRLQPRVPPVQAAELHTCFVLDMLEMMERLSGLADLELHTDTVTDAWGDKKVARYLQTEGDLGARMLHALERSLDAGRPQAMIVGSDSPTLPADHLRLLLDSKADVALGPAEDGGFYAIACRRIHPEMFAGVGWSESLALQQTVQACERCGFSVEIGMEWFDVDYAADLQRLAHSPGLPPHTAAWFRKYAPRIIESGRTR